MYITYADILCELARAGDSLVTQTDTVLSNFVVDAGGDKFDFAGGSPVVGDVICQSGYNAEIIDVTGSTLQINKTGTENKITAAAAKLIHSDTVPKAYGEQQIQIAQEFIEQWTGQWFEPRSKTIRVEGKNSNVMFFRVPIISISEIRVNNATEPTPLTNFEIYSGVDNRRNPRIKLRSGNTNIFATTIGRTFRRVTYSEFDGEFGFVESDGSTPLLIQKATLIMSINALKNPVATSSSLAGVGALKREKVDLHETEYFQPDDIRGGPSGRISGDIEVDRILKMYRAPTGIGGTIMDLPRIEEYERRDFEDLTGLDF